MHHLEEFDRAEPEEQSTLLRHWLRTDPDALLAELRAAGRPVLQAGRLAVVAGRADVVRVLDHPEAFTVEPYAAAMDAVVGAPFLLSSEDPDVRREKAVLQAALRLGDLVELRELVGQHVDRVLDDAADGRVDVVPQLGRAVPAELCETYFGIPGPDRATLLAWSRATQLDLFHNPSSVPAVRSASERAGVELRAYLRRLVDERQEAPARDDVLGRLLAGGQLDGIRLVVDLAGLLIGSIETTSQAVAHVLDRLLSAPPEQWLRAVAAAEWPDRGDFDALVWRALRQAPVSRFVRRLCVQELPLSGYPPTVIAPGATVLVGIGSAMLDGPVPSGAADVPSSDLHFGSGRHACLGRHLAGQVVPEVVRRVLLRDDVIRRGNRGDLDRAGGPFPEHLRIRFRPRATDPGTAVPEAPAYAGLLNTVESTVLISGAPVWWLAQRLPYVSGRLNARLVDRAAGRMAPRPGPVSTMAGYASWPSLVDRAYDARHLPPSDWPARHLPPVDSVTELFARAGDRESDKSTLLFASFAQWFVDGFLRGDRTPGRAPGMNTSTHEIDLCQLYGSTEPVTRQLRTFSGGRLKSRPVADEEFPELLCAGGEVKPEFDRLTDVSLGGLAPEQHDRLYALGSERGNAQVGLLLMGVLFLREHNRVAGLLEDKHSGWSDERLFQTTRAVLVVMLIRIVVGDYIHHIAPYHWRFQAGQQRARTPRWDRPNRMAVEFNLLYRWHSLIPSRRSVAGREVGVELGVVAPAVFDTHSLGALLAEAAAQPTGRLGLFNTDAALLPAERASVLLGRAVRLRSYNDYRMHAGFPRARSFGQVSSDPAVASALRDVYGSVEHLELYVGLFAEDLRPDSVLPPLMGRMVGVDAFSQALSNPLLSHRVYGEHTFGAVGMEQIEATGSLEDVIRRNTTQDDSTWLSMTRQVWRHSGLLGSLTSG